MPEPRVVGKLLSGAVEWRPVGTLRPHPNNPRKHSNDQIKALIRSITEFGWTRAIGIDEDGTILYGHGCTEAAKRMGLAEVPTVTLLGFSEERKRALVIADNRLAEKSSWDGDLLRIQLDELIKLDFDVEITGFSVGEADIVIGGNGAKKKEILPADDFSALTGDGKAVSAIGEVWSVGRHRLVCGDARQGRRGGIAATSWHTQVGRRQAARAARN